MKAEISKVALEINHKELNIIKHGIGRLIGECEKKVIKCNEDGDLAGAKVAVTDLLSNKELYKKVRETLDIFYKNESEDEK